MNRMIGLGFAWLALDVLASFISPGTAGVVGFVFLMILLANLGSVVVSALFRDESSHLLAGFMLAFPGWLLTEFVFHWHLLNPASCAANMNSPAQCGFGTIIGYMIGNLCIVGVGMAVIAAPTLPLLLIMRRQKR
jgi:hypothetical protein